MHIDQIIDKLALQPHPEGGFYREVYRSKGVVPNSVLGSSFSGDRNYCTSIYFLLTSDNFSAFHRIRQDELWHFYGGSPLFVHEISSDGIYTRHRLDAEFTDGSQPQLVIPAGSWFASSVMNQNFYTLVGCTVAPGFDFRDFELGKRKELIGLFPEHEAVIKQLTREMPSQ